MNKKQMGAVLMTVLAMIIGTGTLFAQGTKELPSESYRGQIEYIQPMEDGHNYELLITGIDGNSVLFRTQDQTTATVPLASLKHGDYVEIAFNGIMTRSIPPQATADSVQQITDMNPTSAINLATPTGGTTSAMAGTPRPTVTFTSQTDDTQAAPFPTTTPASPATAQTETEIQATAVSQTAQPTLTVQPTGPTTTTPQATPTGKQTSGISKTVLVDENTFVYRGMVIERSESGTNGNVAVLVQAQLPGIGYGQPEIRFILGPNTSGDVSAVKVGDYVEITYGPAMTASLPPQASALSVKVLPSPAIVTANVVYLGKMFDGKDFKSGSILVRNLANEQEEIYFFDSETVINLDIFDLPVGSHISLYHRGTMTRSIPAQGFVYCIDYTYGE